jgi:hypothetical protein
LPYIFPSVKNAFRTVRVLVPAACARVSGKRQRKRNRKMNRKREEEDEQEEGRGR